jgi:hypothetical protein
VAFSGLQSRGTKKYFLYSYPVKKLLFFFKYLVAVIMILVDNQINNSSKKQMKKIGTTTQGVFGELKHQT